MRRIPRFAFVAGLHRSGTSILSRLLAAHPSISSIEGAPVPENEGCYLQGAIPHTAVDGRPGHYATDPRQHHTEQSRFNTLETQRRLLSDWSCWFDGSRPWWLEKSPVNLVRMRLYQQLFPTSQFIVIVRHPQIVAAAMAKWVDAPLDALLDYVLDAYDILGGDIAYLHAVRVVRYEDVVHRPDAVRQSLFAFLSLDDVDPGIALRDGNCDYEVPAQVAPSQAERMRLWGYLPGGGTRPWRAIVAHPLRAVREASLSCEGRAQNRAFFTEAREKEQKANIRQ